MEEQQKEDIKQKPVDYYLLSPQYVPSYEEETPVLTGNLGPVPEEDNPDLEQNQDELREHKPRENTKDDIGENTTKDTGEDADDDDLYSDSDYIY